MVDQLILLAYNCSYSSKLSLTPEKENSMNIKVRATVEVAGVIAGMMVVIAGVQTIGKYIIDTYGAEAALNGAAFCFMSVAAYIAVSLLYDMRVAKLQYRAKLEEMTKNKRLTKNTI